MQLSMPALMSLLKAFGVDTEKLSAALVQMANAKSVERIMRFADELEEVNGRLAAIERQLGGDAEPGPGTADGGPRQLLAG